MLSYWIVKICPNFSFFKIKIKSSNKDDYSSIIRPLVKQTLVAFKMCLELLSSLKTQWTLSINLHKNGMEFFSSFLFEVKVKNSELILLRYYFTALCPIHQCHKQENKPRTMLQIPCGEIYVTKIMSEHCSWL